VGAERLQLPFARLSRFMAHQLPIWVLLGILAAAVASTKADAQQTPLRQSLDAEEQLQRSDTQPTYDQFNDPETGRPRTLVFDDELVDGGIDEATSNTDTDALGTENEPSDPEDNPARPGRDLEPEGNARVRPAQQVAAPNAVGETTPLANTPVQPEQGGGLRSTDDPFAPLGIRNGSFLLFPTLTQTLGYTDNADFEADGEPSAFSLTSARLRLTSDWAIHQLTAEIGGSYQTFFNGTSDDVPSFDANAELRLDHTRDFTTTWGASFEHVTEDSSSDNLDTSGTAFVVGRTGVVRASAFGQAEKRFGRLNTRLRGSVSRTQFEDADLSDGTSLSQDDRSNTLLTAALRLGYETSPALQPFVEGEAGTRIYDEASDSNGQKRDSLAFSLRGGFAFDHGEKFNGEIAVGYGLETFEDPSLENLSGFVIDAAINWSPERFTTFSATARTDFIPSTTDGESGTITYTGTVGVTRDVRPNWSLNARLLGSFETTEGSGEEEQTLQGTLGSEWRVNRGMAVIGELGYETVDSTDPDSSYDAFTARLGVRLQR